MFWRYKELRQGLGVVSKGRGEEGESSERCGKRASLTWRTLWSRRWNSGDGK